MNLRNVMPHRLTWWLLAGIVGTAAGACAAQDAADVALRAAIHAEVVDGDLQGAIRQYDAIAQGIDRAAAAQALLRMGRCYERLGNAKAREAYERVVTQFADQKEAVQVARSRMAVLTRVAEKPVTKVGWYNGDWQSGVPGPQNWYRSVYDFARVYDDFVVPGGGWTVAGVFSENHMDPGAEVTEVSWEIRSRMKPGSGGELVASGLKSATQTAIPGAGGGPFPRDSMTTCRIQVDGLKVRLAPGRYWLSVAPVTDGRAYINATGGRHAVGDPPGNNGLAFVDRPGSSRPFASAEAVGGRGQLGIGKDFSQGVVILKTSR